VASGASCGAFAERRTPSKRPAHGTLSFGARRAIWLALARWYRTE
jgi:hypothetical protein